MKPAEMIKGINQEALRRRRVQHVHRPARVRDEDNNVVSAFCACGALFNRKMRPAMSRSLRSKIKGEMQGISDEAKDE